MTGPPNLDALTSVELAALTSDLSGPWGPGCDCQTRDRPRVIVERYDDCELWGCLQCRGLYYQPLLEDDYEMQVPLSERDY